MADKEQNEQPQEQAQGGDHIPTTTQDEEEEAPKGSGGLLSKIGDPVGMDHLHSVHYSSF